MQTITWAILGDSTGVGFGAARGQGYVERLRAEVTGVPVRMANFARSGATSARLLAEQVTPAMAARPDIALVFVGGNDVWRGVRPDDYGRTMETIATRLATSGAQVNLVDLPDLSRAPPRPSRSACSASLPHRVRAARLPPPMTGDEL